MTETITACKNKEGPHAGRVVGGTCAACKSRAFLRSLQHPDQVARPLTEKELKFYKPLAPQLAPATTPMPKVPIPEPTTNGQVRVRIEHVVPTAPPATTPPPAPPVASPTDDTDELLQCGGPCRRVLPKTSFYRHRGTKTGFQWQCKQCHDQAINRSHDTRNEYKQKLILLQQDTDAILAENDKLRADIDKLEAALERLEEREARFFQGLS